MTRIQPTTPSQTSDKAHQMLAAVHSKLGMTPNMFTTFAHSPAALEGYLNFSGALASGTLRAKMREQIALTVAQANQCEYCLSAHSALGGGAGLKPEDIAAAREARASDPKTAAGLQFARIVVAQHGQISDGALDAVRQAGYTDGEIVEIVSHVALNVLTNYLNLVAGTEVDFPKVSLALEAPAR